MSSRLGSAGSAAWFVPTPSEAGAVEAQADSSGDLRLRVLSSLVLAPAAIVITWVGGPVFAGAIAAAGVILAREWMRMSDGEASDLSFALVGGGAAGATIAASAGLMTLAMAWMTASAVAAALAGWPRDRALSAGFGVVYVAAPCASLVWLRLLPDPQGARLVIFLFLAVWGADIGAYVAGKLVGGARLAPQVSPNKTWAGAVGGVCLGVVLGVLGAQIGGLATVSAGLMLAAAGLAIAGLCGDLLESVLKRSYGVKDSGSLIPGHGGLMDRVDGLMVASVALALWVGLRGIA